MREILFRGKRVNNGVWVEGCLLIDDMFADKSKWNYDIVFRNKRMAKDKAMVISSTVGQYTGLTDKNGTRIFDGDICCFCNEDDEYTNYEVMWFTNKWVVVMCGTNIADDLDFFFCKRAVVIGNIHDNPELLEESK